jgi:S-DNA-T family DNA segregation ATPase FtsK/SpoIIIE
MVDSRTILDANGAEKLLGRGDMLFMPPGVSKMVRAQGTMTSDNELQRIIEFIKKQVPPPPEPEPAEDSVTIAGPNSAAPVSTAAASDTAGMTPGVLDGPGSSFSAMLEGGTETEGDEDTALIDQSIQIIRETHRASTSSLQRRLRIGYTRAARVMDTLEARGIVGPARGSDPREILIDLDGEIPDNRAPSAENDDETR